MQPSEVWGGEDELQLLRATAEQLGQGLALALDWSLAAPPAPGALVLGSDGAPRSELALKPRLALEELELVEGGLHESFATVGSQVGDVTAGAPLVDLDADEPGHASMASALELRRREGRSRSRGRGNGDDGGVAGKEVEGD